MVARIGQRRNLVAPGVREFGEAVREYHDGRAALTGLGNPQPHAVGVDEPFGRCEHGLSQAQGVGPAPLNMLSRREIPLDDPAMAARSANAP